MIIDLSELTEGIKSLAENQQKIMDTLSKLTAGEYKNATEPAVVSGEVKAETTNAPVDNPPAGQPDPTVEDVRSALMGLASLKGRDAAIELLASEPFCVQKVPDLKPELYGALLTKIYELEHADG